MEGEFNAEEKCTVSGGVFNYAQDDDVKGSRNVIMFINGDTNMAECYDVPALHAMIKNKNFEYEQEYRRPKYINTRYPIFKLAFTNVYISYIAMALVLSCNFNTIYLTDKKERPVLDDLLGDPLEKKVVYDGIPIKRSAFLGGQVANYVEQLRKGEIKEIYDKEDFFDGEYIQQQLKEAKMRKIPNVRSYFLTRNIRSPDCMRTYKEISFLMKQGADRNDSRIIRLIQLYYKHLFSTIDKTIENLKVNGYDSEMGTGYLFFSNRPPGVSQAIFDEVIKIVFNESTLSRRSKEVDQILRECNGNPDLPDVLKSDALIEQFLLERKIIDKERKKLMKELLKKMYNIELPKDYKYNMCRLYFDTFHRSKV